MESKKRLTDGKGLPPVRTVRSSIYEAWQHQQEKTALLAGLNILRRFPKTDRPRGTGYVIDTLWSARKALAEESSGDVIRTAILFGHDTDTTAAVAGGLEHPVWSCGNSEPLVGGVTRVCACRAVDFTVSGADSGRTWDPRVKFAGCYK